MRTRYGLRAVGSLCGIIYGLGSLGAVAQGLLTPVVSEAYGWSCVFAILTACCITSCALLASPAVREYRWHVVQLASTRQ
jgi:sugar phosphate permease